jgi:DNA-directed RNA polymerase specialized sigma24 family protein
MVVWDTAFEAARVREVSALCEATTPAARAEAWRALMTSLSGPIEAWARRSHLLRRAGLGGEDDARWLLVDVLERLARRDFENLRAFRARQRPVDTGRPLDALDTFGRLCEAEGDAADGPSSTPLRAWLLTLIRFAATDHVRRRLGAPPAGGEPTKRGLATDADRLATGSGPGARPPMTDWLQMHRTLEAVTAALETFPAEMRAAVELWLVDADHDEIAATLGLASPAKARALVRAGVARLRERFRVPDALAG